MDYLRKFVSLGHEIGNHGYFHKNQSRLSFEDNVSEIKSNNVVVKNLCGVEMNLFAPPSGDYSETTLKAAKSLDMKVIMWSIDTIDWRDHDDNLIYQRASKANGGDLVLMHPTKNTLNVLDKLLSFYEKNNLRVVTVSTNINILV